MYKRLQTNDVKIYDRVSHRSFKVNRNDVNVAKTKKYCIGPHVWVHPWACNKTPGYYGVFLTTQKTWNMITKTDRRTWK